MMKMQCHGYPVFENFKKAVFVSSLTVVIFLAVLLTVKSSYNAIKDTSFGSYDFSLQWTKYKIVLNRENPYSFAGEKDYPASVKKILEDKRAHLGAREYPPSSAAFLIPLSFLPFLDAAKIYLLGNLILSSILLILFFMLSNKRLTNKEYIFISAVFFAGMPLNMALFLGQGTIYSLVFFMVAFLFDVKKRWFLSGVFLALSLFKYHLILPFVLFFFVIKKRWAPIIVCGVFHTIAHVWICGVMDTSPVKNVFDVLRWIGKACALKASFPIPQINVDIFVVFERMKPFILSEGIYRYGPFAIIIAVFFLTVFLLIKRRPSCYPIEALAMFGMFTLFSSYHGRYDYIYLMFPLLLIFIDKKFIWLRILIGSCVGYFFFLFPLIEKFFAAGKTHIDNLLDMVSICVFYVLYFSIAFFIVPPQKKYKKTRIRIADTP